MAAGNQLAAAVVLLTGRQVKLVRESCRLARLLAPAVLVGSAALFAWFYPIISAAPLSGGKMSYEQWMWLRSWR